MYRSCYRPIRAYSTNGNNGNSVFLSDLLARIEKINLNKSRLNTNEESGKPTKKDTKSTARTGGVNTIKSNNKPSEKPKTVERIQVADHPLFRSRLNKSDKPTRRTRAPRRPVNNDSSITKTTSPSKAGSRPSRPIRAPRKLAQASDATALISKEVHASDYKPSLTNHFLYGKSTNFQMNLTSRITSLVKSQLIKSNYPYKVPKSIINSAGESDNRFLVSNNFSLDIDHDDLKQNIHSVIMGRPQHLPGNSSSINNLNKNPTLSLSQKSSMSDIINSKDFSTVFKNAHWNL